MRGRLMICRFSGAVLVGLGVVRHALCEIDNKYLSFSADVALRARQADRMAADFGKVVMVTGGAGFLGQHIVKLLSERSDHVKEIRVFDTKDFTKKLEYHSTKPVRSYVGDLRHEQDVTSAMEGVDAVIHAGGLVSFGTFPDMKGMEEVNVQGTENVIRACIAQKVPRLVFTSTIDVVVGFEDIIDGDESQPVPEKFLFPGYPITKLRAEQLVLQANGQPLTGDERCLRTLALRPNVMYGEGDPFFVTTALKAAKRSRGTLQRVGTCEALFQQAYVGNVAFAHLVALETLSRDDTVSGQSYFVTDDTPVMNSFKFMDLFLKTKGFSLSSRSVPYSLVYGLLGTAETFCRLVRPIRKVELPFTLCSLIYVNRSIYFSRKKAESLLGYKPLFTYEEGMERSACFYKELDLESV